MDFEAAEQVIAATRADIRFEGNRAVYCPAEDFIRLPPKQSFASVPEYYATAFHELLHWSGHESRLYRLNKASRYGNRLYAEEELIAEIGGCFLCSELGIPNTDMTNRHAYLGEWLKVLENDPKAIFSASSRASKDADFILAVSRKVDEEAAEVVEEPIHGIVA